MTMTLENEASFPPYDPNRMLDAVIDRLNLKNDAALCRVLEIQPPIISKIRHGRLPVGASMLIRLHEETGLHVRELRNLMGDRRGNYRYGYVQGKSVEETAVQD